jgi:Zn-dependent peptidase ImmA (M78 family)/transcriptional regulator with XRE-family HTH domain
MIDTALLASRLRDARERRSLSQQSVADALKLPRTAITFIESGERAVSTLELTKLAALYGQSPAFFLSQANEVEDISLVLHRALPEIKHTPEMEREVQNILDLYQEAASLREVLRGRTDDLAVPNYATRLYSAGDAIRQGESLAQEERRRLGLGFAPIAHVAGLIGEQGIWTAATDLPEGLSGLFINHPATGPAVLVNALHWPARRRFSYAHEYAHALFDRDMTVTTTRRENASELIEKRANAFAAAFLMPPDGVTEALRQLDKGGPSKTQRIIFDVAGNQGVEAEIRTRPGSQAITCQDVILLARHFGVSYEAMVWRLKSLNHINKPETAVLLEQKETAKRAIRLFKFNDLLDDGDGLPPPEPELRDDLMYLAIEAYGQGEISRGRLFELARKVGVDGAELLEFADATRAE